MKLRNKTTRNLRWCCYIALALCVLWIVLFSVNIIRSLFGFDEWPLHCINWSENGSFKIGVFVVYTLSVVMMVAFCVKMVINMLKGLRENLAFPKTNIKLLFWFVLVDFVYHLSYSNLRVLWDNHAVFRLNYENFLIPFFLLFFAFMFKIAAEAVEENNLTV